MDMTLFKRLMAAGPFGQAEAGHLLMLMQIPATSPLPMVAHAIGARPVPRTMIQSGATIRIIFQRAPMQAAGQVRTARRRPGAAAGDLLTMGAGLAHMIRSAAEARAARPALHPAVLRLAVLRPVVVRAAGTNPYPVPHEFHDRLNDRGYRVAAVPGSPWSVVR
jgi:hypothetical protein